eukprot:TCONS_00035606-protein
MPSKYIKLSTDEICSPICHIINTSIQQSIFPSQWKISKISPIPKIESSNEPSDYRPISILPILSKIYEKLIMIQMTNFLEHQELLSQYQSGFRKGHCTVTTCIKIKNDILKAMHHGEITLAVLADFSKAFDTVDFETLIKKLHSLHFSKKSLRILANYLSSQQQYVQIDDKRSPVLTVTNGVLQGSILGPVLFNLFNFTTWHLRPTPNVFSMPTTPASIVTPNLPTLNYVVKKFRTMSMLSRSGDATQT